MSNFYKINDYTLVDLSKVASISVQSNGTLYFNSDRNIVIAKLELAEESEALDYLDGLMTELNEF